VVEGGFIHGCCVGGRIGVRSLRCMEELTVNTKSRRVDGAARRSSMSMSCDHG